MSGQGLAQILVYFVVLVVLAYPLGRYMAWVYSERFRAPRPLVAVERSFYRLVGTRADREQDWKGYAKSALLLMAVFSGLLYVLLRLQGHLPLNPDHLGAVFI